jgi:S1-C subfamily serine protease
MKKSQKTIHIFAGIAFVATANAFVRVAHCDALTDATESVVQVSCKWDQGNAASGSGFVWGDDHQIVTSLHLVVGGPRISVYYESKGLMRTATVTRVSKDYDLALLAVETPPDVPALKVANGIPAGGDKVTALGFPYGGIKMRSTDGKVREIGGKHLKEVVNGTAETEIANLGFPNLDDEILDIDAPLVAGHSGAPVLNDNGEVVGIVDGGLEKGIGDLAWAIPSTKLTDLASSNDSMPNGLGGTRALFRADMRASVGKPIKAGGVELVKVRTRKFSELQDSTDDPFGLAQMRANVAARLPNLNVDDLEYDIYEDTASGASLVVPSGAKLTPKGDHFFVRGQRQGLSMEIAVQRAASEAAAVEKTNNIDRYIAEVTGNIPLAIDPNWTYFQPKRTSSGMLVRRAAEYAVMLTPTGPVQTHNIFGTSAVLRNVALMTAAIDTNQTNPDKDEWIQMALGVHLSTFSQAGAADGN